MITEYFSMFYRYIVWISHVFGIVIEFNMCTTYSTQYLSIKNKIKSTTYDYLSLNTLAPLVFKTNNILKSLFELLASCAFKTIYTRNVLYETNRGIAQMYSSDSCYFVSFKP